jgi:6-phosphogluconolactonase (cycloisomerase 2 family)
MRTILRAAVGAAVAAGFAAVPALAGADPGHGAQNVVFVQTDSLAGNAVVAYDRAATGALTPAGIYPTRGHGGALHGSAVDHLASQGSLTYDPDGRLLLAVNAGSDTVSVFGDVEGHLYLRQVLPSNGTFPVSFAVHGDLVYVLNALNGGSITGFRAAGGLLHPLPGSTRNLGLTTPGDTTQFTHTPGQIGFTPSGSALLVTTKAASNAVDVFSVRWDGRPSNRPVVNTEPTTVPFAFTFDATGRLVLTEAGPDAVAEFSLNPNGTLTHISTVTTGQGATCWIASAQGYFYASNAASASVTGIAEGPDGPLSSLGNTRTGGGTVDAAASAGGRFLYVQTGATGTVDEFQVGDAGTLSEIGSVTVPGAVGGEGIVAS